VDFELTEDQERRRQALVDFARRELNGDVVGRDARQEFPREAWRRCAAFGVQGLPVPGAYGGTDADPLSIALAMEALGYGCEDNGLLFALNAQMWSCQIPIVRFGTEAQKRRYLPGLCDGSLVAGHAMTEPGSGSDAFSLTTTAVRDGDDFVLDGSKVFVTNAPEADVLVVFATVDPGTGFAGVTAFLVDRPSPGLTVGPPVAKMGLRTALMGEVVLHGCRVPADHVLGRPGAGLAVFNCAMEWERSLILACSVGTMQRQLERCVRYAKERRQFGRPIGSFQAVSDKLVDMKLRVETSRLMLYHLAWLMGTGASTAPASALAKLHLSESFVATSLDAVQVHGGLGYLTDTGLERDLRDAIAGRIYSGTSEIQRSIVARSMGL
jgi:alkylation response protein AidB-like acyl-CoA dehydrogenase